ncbi:hypothetical protein BDZ97DRAFT_1918582 [Flammula alnicola]|nr:hypothetical protein BDZ97DRAFT_1918582 [Flammula alnicola]
MRFFTTAVSLSLLALSALGAVTPLHEIERFNGPTTGRFIVKLKDGVSKDKLRVLAKVGASVTHSWEIVNGFAANLDDNTLNFLRASPDVEFFAEEGIMHTMTTQTNAPWDLARLSSTTKLANQNPKFAEIDISSELPSVYHRLSLSLSETREKIWAGVPTILKTSLSVDINDKTAIARLIDKCNYIYPSKDGNFVYHKPFQGDFVRECISMGFFGSGGISPPFSRMFSSSSPEHPTELEIPAYMVAVAATGGHATLQSLLLGGDVDFADSTFENTFRAHMTLLVQLRTRKLLVYHKVMHQLYKSITGTNVGIGGNQTAEDILQNVDWEKMVDSD